MKIYGQNKTGIYTDYKNIISDDNDRFNHYYVLLTTADPKISYVVATYTTITKRDFELANCINADKNNYKSFTFRSEEELNQLMEDSQEYSDNYLLSRIEQPVYKLIYDYKKLLEKEEAEKNNFNKTLSSEEDITQICKRIREILMINYPRILEHRKINNID